MHLPVPASRLNARSEEDIETKSNNGVYIGVGVTLAIVLVIYSVYAYFRRVRRTHENPKYIPTSFLKSQWRSWVPKAKYGRVSKDNSPTHTDETALETTTASAPSIEISTPSNTAQVDRNTSVRSIMTLPPYRPSPNHDERLIAREGERAGVDTVIEYPETEAELEVRREEEMESLYQIRQARRQEVQAREERRRQRREAREAGDWARLEQLRIQSQMRARAESGASVAPSAGSSTTNLNNSDVLIAELASTREGGNRDRRVSSVSYAELGLARHDGTRIRADSVESDNRPLLDSAASMGGHHSRHTSQIPSRQGSPFRPPVLPHHRREFSTGSIITVDSSVPDTPRTSTHGTRSGSGDEPQRLTPHSSSDDNSEAPIPSGEPPRYEDEVMLERGAHQEDEEAEEEEEAPPYSSPIAGRGEAPPTLPPLRHLPSIEIEGATPYNSMPPTPVNGDLENRRGR